MCRRRRRRRDDADTDNIRNKDYQSARIYSDSSLAWPMEELLVQLVVSWLTGGSFLVLPHTISSTTCTSRMGQSFTVARLSCLLGGICTYLDLFWIMYTMSIHCRLFKVSISQAAVTAGIYPWPNFTTPSGIFQELHGHSWRDG
jgi:hypothetical protein